MKEQNTDKFQHEFHSTLRSEKFDLDMLKNRNKQINKSSSTKRNEGVKENYIDEKALEQLQELIKKDESNKQGYKNLENSDEPLENIIDEKQVLVHRPGKNFVWGLGQQTKQRKFKFIQGEYPNVDSLVNFLEINNIQDIVVVPTHQLGLLHLRENSIVCSGFTAKHIYKTAKDLTVELKKLQIPNLPFIPTIFGRKDSEWLLVEIGQISIHFFVESYRKDYDLVDVWLNPLSKETIDAVTKISNKRYEKRL
jgi:ribosomal silencing factor RsfS